MAYSYLGYGENLKKELNQSSLINGQSSATVLPTGENLNDPHNKLNLTARYKERQSK